MNLGNSVIVHNQAIYNRMTNISEHPNFEQLAVKNMHALFGPNVIIYLNEKIRIKSIAGTTKIPDGLLLTANNVDSKLWLVEYELEDHNLEEHVIPQVTGFVRALEDPETITRLRDLLDEHIECDENASKRLKSIINGKNPLRFLESVVKGQKGIIIVYDKIPSDEKKLKSLKEVLANIEDRTRIKSTILEFTPFQNRVGDQVFLLTPLGLEGMQKTLKSSPQSIERTHFPSLRDITTLLKNGSLTEMQIASHFGIPKIGGTRTKLWKMLKMLVEQGYLSHNYGGTRNQLYTCVKDYEV